MQRRHFIQLGALGLSSVISSRLTFAAGPDKHLINLPDSAWAMVNNQWIKLTGSGQNGYTYQDIKVTINPDGNAQAVYINSPQSALQAVKLNWKYDAAKYKHALGDHWERSYGDLAWKAPAAATHYPWYLLLHDGTDTAGFGVKTGPSTMCWWEVDGNSLSLVMDTHSGGMPVKLGQRKLHAASIVTYQNKPGENAYAALTSFCKVMCPKPRLPKQPVYGINDWYFAYGNNSEKSITEQTKMMASFVTSTSNRPFSVIDDGWEQADDFSISNPKFPDMHRMANTIKDLGMRPGLWTRTLIARLDDPASYLAPRIPGRNNPKEPILDPTVPETLERIRKNFKLYRDWGYEMVKHDYSNLDIFGRWGMQMQNGFTQPGWHFHDQTRTNAEIVGNLYHTIREAAGDMYLIGCNTLSHHSAGVFELNRTGDDTSGKEWARTKKMGVNTLAFRLPQHNTFYAADGDCVGVTKDIAWDKNKQWLQLLAESGSPLFISADTDSLTAEKRAAIKTAFTQAAKVQPTGEPLDWITDPFPTQWKLNNRKVTFNWD
jgi:alpha-galactosidase